MGVHPALSRGSGALGVGCGIGCKELVRGYGHLMTYAWRPPFDLRMAARPITLRSMWEADLARLAAMLPENSEQDPSAIRYAVADACLSRGIIAHQSLLGA